MTYVAAEKPLRRALVLLIGGAAVVYLLVSYGGIRSPDSELVFRTGEALVTRGSFALETDLPWSGFGIASGRDGRRYAIFGPGQAVLWAPWTAMAGEIQRTGWYRRWPLPVPVSPYAGPSVGLRSQPGPNASRADDALRMASELPYALVSAATVGLFFLVALRLSGSQAAALAAAVLVAFGTLLLPYSGTFFSEPLTTLLCLASFACAIPRSGAGDERSRALAAGLLLGVAVTVHVTAILFAPFFLVVVGWDRSRSVRWAGTAAFLVGFLGVCGVLAAFNWLRFGDPLETGRTVAGLADRFGYGFWTVPWRGLAGLLVSPGKGLLLFCPAVLLAVPAWPALHRRAAILSWSLLGAVVFRVVLIAARSDWHGGFCLGPRLLVPLIPFLVLPVACWLAENDVRAQRRRLAVVGVVAIACTTQQLYFSLGEVFTFLHGVKAAWLQVGVNPFVDDLIYLDWSSSPLFQLLPGKLGPWPLAGLPPGGTRLWIACSVVSGGIITLCFRRLIAATR